ncbi:hypothetical protein TNCV_589901 [Trichonephila clavipes]|nr:hypothetical protein TNCV_589901 [Trichonephila clavipes]
MKNQKSLRLEETFSGNRKQGKMSLGYFRRNCSSPSYLVEFVAIQSNNRDVGDGPRSKDEEDIPSQNYQNAPTALHTRVPSGNRINLRHDGLEFMTLITRSLRPPLGECILLRLC